MSRFGDSNWQMNDIYDCIAEFFDDGGTIEQLFAVLKQYFENHEFREECDK